MTKQLYRDYRLVVEYRFPGKGGNCGILVHASTAARTLQDGSPSSIEVQMNSGDAGDFWVHPGGTSKSPTWRSADPRAAGEKWGRAEGDARRILNLTDGSEKPLGQWNTMVIEVRQRTITVWVNDVKVNDGFACTADQGKIAIQAEGTEVEFRRVEMSHCLPRRSSPALIEKIEDATVSGCELGCCGTERLAMWPALSSTTWLPLCRSIRHPALGRP